MSDLDPIPAKSPIARERLASPRGRIVARPGVMAGLVALVLFGFLPLLALGTAPGQRLIERAIEAPLLARLEASAPAPFVLDVDDLRTTVGGSTLKVELVGTMLSAPGVSLALEDVSVRVRYIDVLRGNLVPERIEVTRAFLSVDDLSPVRDLGQRSGVLSGFGFQSAPVAAINDFSVLAEEEAVTSGPYGDVAASLALDGLLNAFDALDQALSDITLGATWRSLKRITVALVEIDPRPGSSVPLLRTPEPFEISIERANEHEMIARVTSLQRSEPLSLIVRHAETALPEGPAALAEMAGADISDGDAYSHVLIRGLKTSDVTRALQGSGPVQFSSALAAELVVVRQEDNVGVDQVIALFESEAGYLLAGENAATILEFASIPMIYTRQSGQLDIISAQIRFQQTGGVFNGSIVPAFRDGRQGLTLSLRSPNYRLAVPAQRDLGRPAQTASANVELEAFADDSGQFIDISLLEVAVGDARLAQAGIVDLSGEAPIVTLVGRSTPMRVNQLAAMWPLPISPGARDWFLDNVSEGAVGEGEFTFAARMDEIEVRDGRTYLADDMMSLSAPFENLVLRTVGDLPAVFGLDGQIEVTGRSVRLAAEGGVGRLESGEMIEVARADFTIEDHAQRNPPAVLELDLVGPASGFAHMVLMEPISLDDGIPFEPQSVVGDVTLSTRIETRLSNTIDRDAVRTTTLAQIVGFGSGEPIDGRTVSDGALTLEVDEAGTRVSGTARLDGVTTELDFNSGDAQGVQLAMQLDAEDRERLGIDFGDYLTGTINVDVGDQASDGTRAFVVDLTAASLRIPELGWTKAAGVPGRASFDLSEEGADRRIRNLVIATQGLSARGSLNLTDGDLRQAEFDSVAIEGIGRFSVLLTRNQSRTTARLRGDRFVLTPDMLRSDRASAGDLSLDVAVDRLVNADGARLSDVQMTYAQNGSRVSQFTLAARHSDGTVLTGELAQRDGQERIVISSQNAGTFLRFLGLYERAEGGRALLLLDPTSVGGRVVGEMLLRDYQVVNEPAMERIFSDGAREQQSSARVILPGEFETSARVDMQVTNVTFDRTPERLVIHKAEGWGPSLGGNIQGIINYNADEVRMRGTFVPFFSINNIFSRIPILGQALGGRESEGLFGITFELVGTVDEPSLRVNPISILAPGVFRDLFEFQQGG